MARLVTLAVFATVVADNAGYVVWGNAIVWGS